jgi:hypothetical protein
MKKMMRDMRTILINPMASEANKSGSRQQELTLGMLAKYA